MIVALIIVAIVSIVGSSIGICLTVWYSTRLAAAVVATYADRLYTQNDMLRSAIETGAELDSYSQGIFK